MSEDDSAPCPTNHTPRDVRDPEGDTAMSQGSWSSSEDTSAVASGTDDGEQDQELFLEAYSSFKRKSSQFNSAGGLQEWFDGVERLPDSWPMARLAITLDGLILQVEKVAMTAAMEIIASHVAPGECLPELTQLAKDITVALALHLADLVASFLTGVLDGQAVLLFGTGTSALLQASYWVRPIYEELLYMHHRTLTKALTWKPVAQAMDLPKLSVVKLDRRWTNRHKQLAPVSARCFKLPGQSLNVEYLLPGFPTVLQGIVRGVFRQQAGGAWFPSKTVKISLTVIMPQSSEPHHWFTAVAGREGSWPMELPNPRPLLRPLSLRTFSRMRRRALSPHLWGCLEPDWTAGGNWLYLDTPAVETERQIRRKFDTRDNRNLVDRFAKPHERAAHTPRWRAAQAELASLRGRQHPTFDMHVRWFLASVVARYLERSTIRTRVLEAHVNLAVWRDKYGRLWPRKP